MPKSTSLANGLVNLIFRNTDYAGVGDATGLRGSSSAGNVYISLHTADPGVGGTASTSEISYTGYARVAMARATSWSAGSSGATSPAANIDFGAMTAGTGGTVTHFAVSSGTTGTGAATLLYIGTVTPNIAVSNGVTPRLTTATTVTEA